MRTIHSPLLAPLLAPSLALSLALVVLGSWNVAAAAESAPPPASPGLERPTRTEIFEHINGPAAPSESPAPPTNPHAPLILPEVRHDVTITGKLTRGLRLDLELQYLSTNKFRDVLIGGVGWVKEPLPKMLRPGVTYKEDGTYEIKFSMFNSSWLSGKFQMHYARIGILKRGAAPTYFDLRADKPAAPPMLDVQRVSVTQMSGAHGTTLSADVVTPAGSAPHRVVKLPGNPGWSAYTIDVTQDE